MATISSTFKMQDKATSTLNSISSGIDSVIDRADALSSATSDMTSGMTNINPALNSAISSYNNLIAKQEQINQKIELMSRQEKLLVQDLAKEQSAYNQNEKAILRVQKQLFNVRTQKDKLIRQSDKLTNEILDQASAVTKVADNTKKIKSPQENVNSGFSAWQAKLVTINQGLQLAKSIAGVIKKGLDYTDELTLTKARLNLINDGQRTTVELQDQIFAAAQRSRGEYGLMAQSVAKLGLLAGDAFKSNDEMIAFSEMLNKSFKVSGSSTQEISSATYQLTQAMAAGKLQGDEFRAIMENAPMLADAIAKYLGKSKGELKELSSEGVITSDIIKNALFSSADDINAKFETMPKTFGDATTNIKNNVMRTFQPIADKISEMLNSEKFNSALNLIISGIALVGSIIIPILDVIFSILGGIYDFISTNWPTISLILMTIGMVLLPTIISSLWSLISGFIVMGVNALIAGIQAFIGMMLALGPIGLIIVALLAIIGILKIFGVSFEQTFGFIGGVVGVTIAFIWNLFLGLFDFVLSIVNYFRTMWQGFADFFKNLFKDPLGAAVLLFMKFADAVLGIVEGVAKLIDKVFGSNLAGSVDKFRGKAKQFADDFAKEKGLDNTEVEQLTSESFGLKRMEYDAAWNKGAEIGGNIGAGLDNIMGSIGGIFDQNKSLEDQLAGYDMNSMIDGNGNLPVDVKKNSDKEVDISDEDLKMLRDIANKDYMLNYKQITPNVNIEFGDVRETADVGKIKKELQRMMEEELAELYVVEEG